MDETDYIILDNTEIFINRASLASKTSGRQSRLSGKKVLFCYWDWETQKLEIHGGG